MNTLKNLLIGSAAIMASAAIASAASAQTTCGLTGAGAFSATINYDPFAGGSPTVASGSITLTRNVSQAHTFYFHFTAPSGTAPGIAITTTQTGSANTLFYEVGGGYPGAPDIETPSGSGYISAFGSSGGGNTVVVPFVITIPPGLDFVAGPSFPLGIRYTCRGVGQIQSQTSSINIAGALTVQANVLSALQASWVGPNLAFGEIGTIDTPTVTGAPATYSRAGNLRVASTGPYTVAMTSDNGYRLAHPDAADAGGRIGYEVDFLNQIKTTASPSFTTTHCLRAGLSGELLPLTARLLEGGQGKDPSSAYVDTLNVTVTPVVTAVSPSDCSAL